MTTLAAVARRAAERARPVFLVSDAALAQHPPPAEVVKECGRHPPQILFRLVEAYGGTRLWVPHRVNQASELARTIGLPAARQMAAAQGGTWAKVPVCRWWLVAVMRADGATHHAIALHLRMSEDAVWRLLRDAGMTRQASAQPSLFD